MIAKNCVKNIQLTQSSIKLKNSLNIYTTQHFKGYLYKDNSFSKMQ